MSRPTPFDVVFGSLDDELAALAATTDPGAPAPGLRDFAKIPGAQRLLQRIEVPELLEARPDAADEYLSLLYAAFRFQAAGRRVLAPTRERLEALLSRPAPGDLPRIPGGACYVQLPAHRIWAQVTANGPHEPLDGMFVVTDPRGDAVLLVAVLGLRSERGGFTQVTVRAGLDGFVEARTMQRVPPFAALMDGGAAQGYRSVANAAELLTLSHLALLAAGE